MKKIITLFAVMLMMMCVVYSAPPFPAPIELRFTNGANPASNINVKITCNTGQFVERTTTSDGMTMVDVGDASSDFDTACSKITVEAMGDVSTYDTVNYELPNNRINIVLNYVAPVECPSCPSCGSCSGGSSGGVIYKATQELCDKDFPCKNTVCPEMTYEKCHSEFPCHPDDSDCGECEVCPSQESCQDTICEECVEDNNLGLVLAALAGLIMIIGGGVQVYKNRAGGITMLHRHRGITGYHDMDTQHKNKEYRHVAFSKDPAQFMKDMKRING